MLNIGISQSPTNAAVPGVERLMSRLSVKPVRRPGETKHNEEHDWRPGQSTHHEEHDWRHCESTHHEEHDWRHYESTHHEEHDTVCN